MKNTENKLVDRLEAVRKAASAGAVPKHLVSKSDAKTESAWGPAMRV